MFKANLNLRIDKYTKDTLMMLKSQNKTSMSHIVRIAIKEYIEKGNGYGNSKHRPTKNGNNS